MIGYHRLSNTEALLADTLCELREGDFFETGVCVAPAGLRFSV